MSATTDLILEYQGASESRRAALRAKYPEFFGSRKPKPKPAPVPAPAKESRYTINPEARERIINDPVLTGSVMRFIRYCESNANDFPAEYIEEALNGDLGLIELGFLPMTSDDRRKAAADDWREFVTRVK